MWVSVCLILKPMVQNEQDLPFHAFIDPPNSHYSTKIWIHPPLKIVPNKFLLFELCLLKTEVTTANHFICLVSVSKVCSAKNSQRFRL